MGKRLCLKTTDPHIPSLWEDLYFGNAAQTPDAQGEVKDFFKENDSDISV